MHHYLFLFQFEDLSDEAFLNRHEIPEAEERKRFRNFITYPPVRRSRLSRESESNTIDSFPSDINLHESGSQSELHVALHSSTCTLKEEGRRRSSSTSAGMSRRGSFLDDSLNSYWRESFERDTVDPFVPRQFPLPDDIFEEMQQEQIAVTRNRNVYHRSRHVRVQDDPSMEFISPEFDLGESQYVAPDSPGGSFVSVEDENDPEWNQARGDRRCSLSMRHSKR